GSMFSDFASWRAWQGAPHVRPCESGSCRLHLSGGVVVGEAQERVATEGAVVASQLAASEQVVVRGGVKTKIQASRIVAVVEKARIVGAHDPSFLPGDWPVSVFQNKIPQDFVLGQIIDDVIEAGVKRPNDRPGRHKFFAEKTQSST